MSVTGCVNPPEPMTLTAKLFDAPGTSVFPSPSRASRIAKSLVNDSVVESTSVRPKRSTTRNASGYVCVVEQGPPQIVAPISSQRNGRGVGPARSSNAPSLSRSQFHETTRSSSSPSRERVPSTTRSVPMPTTYGPPAFAIGAVLTATRNVVFAVSSATFQSALPANETRAV